MLDRSGNVLGVSGEEARGVPALRRAQVDADDAALLIVKHLLRMKVLGQRSNLERFLPKQLEAIELVTTAAERINSSDRIRDALAWEAKAATAYWRSLAGMPMRFAAADLARIPERWLMVGERHSLLSASPRRAISPAHAMINLLYQLAEFECRNALLALGLDPQLGWAHCDAAYRDSAALDLLESVRPHVDRYVATLLADRTFARKEFLESADGQVRLAPSLAKLLAESTLAEWERAAAQPAEEIARILAASARQPVTVRTRLTQADRKRGRVGASGRQAGSLRPACRQCGKLLSRKDRQLCEGCLPEFDAERTRKLSIAGTKALARMRASVDDPARSPAAIAKRSKAVSRREVERRAWDREHGPEVDPARYERDLWPLIQQMEVGELARQTGLTKHYCWQVRKGEKRLHPRHWRAVLDGS